MFRFLLFSFFLSFSVATQGLTQENPKQLFPKSPTFFLSQKNGNPVFYLKQDWLGKNFLLRASLSPQQGLASSQGSLSRIVRFELKGGRLFLMEDQGGKVVSPDLPSQIILAEVPILFFRDGNEDEIFLGVDLNSALSKVFPQTWIYGTDFDRSYRTAEPVLGLEITHSYIEPIQIIEDTVEFKQVVQVKRPGRGSQTFFPTYEVDYYLGPYAPNPEFQPKELRNFERVGFFQAYPVYEPGSGRSTVRAARWHIPKSGKITYWISASTPEEFVEAVREGLLYWNKVFKEAIGREVLEAKVAPKGVTAPRLDRNMVQWVEFDSAGMAYADANLDPLTGEILNSQIYMTSVFAISSREQLKETIRRLQQKEDAPKKEISGHFCQRGLEKAYLTALETFLAQNATDEQILKLSKDYIRQVMAHEVGHTLGLRHNFVGKSASTVSPQEVDQIFTSYLSGLSGSESFLEKKDFLVSSTVMEYLNYAEDVLAGRMILEKTLPYDVLAIRWGYSDLQEHDIFLNAQEAPLFCTDSGFGVFGDCEVFTSGKNPIIAHTYSIQKALKALPKRLVQIYIIFKTAKDPRDQVSPLELNPSPAWFMWELLYPSYRNLMWLNADTRSVMIERKLSPAELADQKIVRTKVFEWVKEQINQAGGVEKVYFSTVPSTQTKSQIDQAIEEVKKYLSLLREKGFVGPDDNKTYFTSQEEEAIISYAKRFFPVFFESIGEQTFDFLLDTKVTLESSVNNYLDPNGISATFEKKLLETAKMILLTQNDEQVLKGHLALNPKMKPQLLIPAPLYTYALREKAAQLLSGKLSQSLDWSLEARREVVTALKERLESALGRAYHEIKVHQIGRPLREWVVEEIKLIGQLVSEGHCADILAPPPQPASTAPPAPPRIQEP